MMHHHKSTHSVHICSRAFLKNVHNIIWLGPKAFRHNPNAKERVVPGGGPSATLQRQITIETRHSANSIFRGVAPTPYPHPTGRFHLAFSVHFGPPPLKGI
ncbi:unnamed protein product, partial [Iphiclides podalirius]